MTLIKNKPNCPQTKSGYHSAIFGDGNFGLLAAVSRIAAILPNDLAPTNMNGPDQTLAPVTITAQQHSHCCHSCMAQHVLGPSDRNADETAVH